MLSKLNFINNTNNTNNTNKNSKNIQRNLITIQQQISENIKKNDGASIANSLNITKKIHQNNQQFLDIKKINNGKKTIIEDMYSIKQIKAGITNKINIDFVDSSKLAFISLKDNDILHNINVVRNKGIQIINNVYQSKYNYGKYNCTGLGDFIRGCYFILEFCDKFGFQPKIIFNNCISKFLHIKTHKLDLIQNVLRSIDFFKYNNITSYNVQNDTLGEVNLSIKEYNVIHVRSGDRYLKNDINVFSNRYIEKLMVAIRSDMHFNGQKYLIIADNNAIKIALKNTFPDFKILLKDITHFGEGVVLEEEKVKNSLVDFYLLSLSKSIFSYSCYEHGSGFSSWCAKTYNIPYMCRLVK